MKGVYIGPGNAQLKINSIYEIEFYTKEKDRVWVIINNRKGMSVRSSSFKSLSEFRKEKLNKLLS